MSGRDVARRRLWSGMVFAVFMGALGTLAWTWTTIHDSSAAFADREVIDGNLGAGTVDVALGGDTVTFSARNMAAGDVASGHLELLNEGTLPFTYALSASSNGGPLADVIDLVAWLGSPLCAAEPPGDANPWRPIPARSSSSNSGGDAEPTRGRLAPDESSLLCMRAALPLSAPSAVQGQRLDLVITVSAEHDVDGTP